jgi:hypothetical protein
MSSLSSCEFLEFPPTQELKMNTKQENNRTRTAKVGWGILWLGSYLVRVGLPGILFIIPALIGVALLMKSSDKSI